MTRGKSTKLTLTVDPTVVGRAKSYAASHNTSISALIEAYLKQLTEAERAAVSADPRTWPPLTRRLFGSLGTSENSEIDEKKIRREYLTKKYLHD